MKVWLAKFSMRESLDQETELYSGDDEDLMLKLGFIGRNGLLLPRSTDGTKWEWFAPGDIVGAEIRLRGEEGVVAAASQPKIN